MNEDERKLAEALGIESDDEDLDHNIRTSAEFKQLTTQKKQSTPKIETSVSFGKKQPDLLFSADSKKSRTDSPDMPRRQTYQRLFEEKINNTNISRRYTAGLISDNEIHHVDTHSLLTLMFPTEVRKQKMLSYTKWGLINLCLFGYLLTFIVIFWK